MIAHHFLLFPKKFVMDAKTDELYHVGSLIYSDQKEVILHMTLHISLVMSREHVGFKFLIHQTRIPS